MASSPIALSKESVLEIVNHKGFDLIIIRHTKQSRFGRLDGQKMAYFVCAFERKVNRGGFGGLKARSARSTRSLRRGRSLRKARRARNTLIGGHL